MEALRPSTTGLGIASPGGADVGRLPAVAAAVLPGAMAIVAVVAAASPVEVAGVIRAKPGLMLAQWAAVVGVAAVAVVTPAAS